MKVISLLIAILILSGCNYRVTEESKVDAREEISYTFCEGEQITSSNQSGQRISAACGNLLVSLPINKVQESYGSMQYLESELCSGPVTSFTQRDTLYLIGCDGHTSLIDTDRTTLLAAIGRFQSVPDVCTEELKLQRFNHQYMVLTCGKGQYTITSRTDMDTLTDVNATLCDQEGIRKFLPGSLIECNNGNTGS